MKSILVLTIFLSCALTAIASEQPLDTVFNPSPIQSSVKVVPSHGDSAKHEITFTISKQLHKIRKTYNKFLKKNDALKGRIKFKFTINTKGAVTSLSIVENTLNDKAFELEVISWIQGLKFKPFKEPTEVVYPFIFSKDDIGSEKSVQTIIKQHKKESDTLYYERKKDNPALSGIIEFSILTDSTGKVLSIELLRSTVKDIHFEYSIINWVRSLPFEPTHKQTQTVITLYFNDRKWIRPQQLIVAGILTIAFILLPTLGN